MSSEDIEVRRSRRRRRTVSAYRDGARTVVLIPASFSAAEEARWVERMLARLTAGDRRRNSSDVALAARAEQLSRRYLGGHARPTSVRWVSTMGRRWASCTPAEGTIRVSDRLRDVPDHVLDPTGGRVLLTLHRRANAWFQFGGHLEAADSSVWGAARREAREESGIDILEPLPRPVQLDRHRLVGSFDACREHLDLRYAAVAPDGARSRVSAESHDVRWWPVDALPEGTGAELAPLVSLARDAFGLG